MITIKSYLPSSTCSAICPVLTPNYRLGNLFAKLVNDMIRTRGGELSFKTIDFANRLGKC